MHRQLQHVRRGMLLLGLVLIAVSVLWAQGIPNATSQKSGPPPLPEFAEAEQTLKAIDEVGPRLMKLLADEKRPKVIRLYPLENRHEAAIWLGKLRYQPAIPMLIQYIHTEGPAYDNGPTYPCSEALQMYGDAAVPSLVDAYMVVDNIGTDRARCLLSAIAHKSMPTAWTYAKGLAAENPNLDQNLKTRIEFF